MWYKTKWQNDFASKVSSMSDKEIFELVAFSYKVLTSGDEYPKEGFTLREENQWKYTLLTDTFQVRMGWIKFDFSEDSKEIWEHPPLLYNT